MNLMQKAAFVVALGATVVVAQEQRGTEKATVAGKAVTVEYGRPLLAGRDMLSQAKPGVPWRMGAGSPTSLKTEADLSFGAVAVPKGNYILTATKDDKGGWTLIASKAEGGAKVAEIPLKSETVNPAVDMYTISVTGKDNAGTFAMTWGTAKMSAPFTGK